MVATANGAIARPSRRSSRKSALGWCPGGDFQPMAASPGRPGRMILPAITLASFPTVQPPGEPVRGDTHTVEGVLTLRAA
jgi:hypothetical protein